MIGLALGMIGKLATGPLQAVLGKYIGAKTDRTRIAADIEINRQVTTGVTDVARIEGQTSVTVQSINAETAQLQKRPFIMLIAQVCMWSISLSYFAALVFVSVLPVGWDVQRLPPVWEVLTLGILATLGGPQLVNLLKKRLGL